MKVSKTVNVDINFNDALVIIDQASNVAELLILQAHINHRLESLKDGEPVQLPKEIFRLPPHNWNEGPDVRPSPKIHLIKAVRLSCCLGLKEAKEAVEQSKAVQCYGRGYRQKLVDFLKEHRAKGWYSED